MAKASPAEHDEAQLQKKVQDRLAGHDSPEADASLRALRKRLKRTQRKRRARSARSARAKGADGEKAPS